MKFKQFKKIKFDKTKNQSGQVVIILLLVIVVSMSIGLSVAGRSVTEIASSSRAENTSRAYFAAEAGIEHALGKGGTSTLNFSNNSKAMITGTDLAPLPGQALEYPPIARERTAQVWLADPRTDPPTPTYLGDTIEVYFGKCVGATRPNLCNPSPVTPVADLPAIAITLVYKDSAGVYKLKRYFADANAARSETNGFSPSNTLNQIDGQPNCAVSSVTINTEFSPTAGTSDRSFLCRVTLNNVPSPTSVAPNIVGTPILMRVKILYSPTNQPFAIKPTNRCAGNSVCILPPQAAIFTSIGRAGDVQRTLQVFRIDNVVPQLFDYSIFSVAELKKGE